MLIDNKKNGKVGDILKEHIEKNCSLSIVSSYFTIYAYEALKKELSKVDEVKLLFSAPFSALKALHLQIYQAKKKRANTKTTFNM